LETLQFKVLQIKFVFDERIYIIRIKTAEMIFVLNNFLVILKNNFKMFIYLISKDFFEFCFDNKNKESFLFNKGIANCLIFLIPPQ